MSPGRTSQKTYSPAQMMTKYHRNTRSITNFTMQDRTVTINNSKAHQRYSFGKDERFKDPKILIDVVQYDLPDTVRIKGATSANKQAGFGLSIPDRFFNLSMKKKMELPGPDRYFEEPREASKASNEDIRSMHKTASRAAMHSVIEKNKYSSLEQSISQVSLHHAR